MQNDSPYLPLATSPLEGLHESEWDAYKRRKFSLRETFILLVIILQSSVIVIFAAIVLWGNKLPNNAIGCHTPEGDGAYLYSPAQTAVGYQVKSFTAGRENKTIYQGASEDVDRAWGKLYNHTLLMIPKREAALLPNRTWPIKEHPGYYIAALDVFHQLHCLNNIRRALHRDYYVNDTDLDEEHVSHCVDTIRQSLMCSADISVNVWQWSEELSAVVGYSTQAHTCRNFEKIRDWALDHRLPDWIDVRTYVEDDLPEPPIIY